MALSGKEPAVHNGSSRIRRSRTWTGYTVFGRVIRGMDVVDNIARGDVIRRMIISER